MNIITDLDNSLEKIIMLPNKLKNPHIFFMEARWIGYCKLYRVKREIIGRISTSTNTSREPSNEWHDRSGSQQLKNTQELRSGVPTHRSSTKP
jgi:hypothetical protein